MPDNAAILDIGCGKGFMLHDFKGIMQNCSVTGIDVSEYAIENAMDSVKAELIIGSADQLDFTDNSFDLVISINSI